jgi:hypothetical protein
LFKNIQSSYGCQTVFIVDQIQVDPKRVPNITLDTVFIYADLIPDQTKPRKSPDKEKRIEAMLFLYFVALTLA